MGNDSKGFYVGAAAVVLISGAGAWFLSTRHPVSQSPVEAPSSAPAARAPANGAQALPKLEDSDEWVRGRTSTLSSDPRLRDWAKADHLLARWAAAINIIAAGRVPTDGLSFLRPQRKFAFMEKAGRITIDPRSYARYDAVAETFASIDARAAAELFRAARPLIDVAWGDLGEGRGGVEDALARASRQLLAAPVVPDAAELRPSGKGITYAYVESGLEGRSPVQKQLMRMGPRNQRLVQAKVRELALAIGVPETALR